MLKIIFHFIIKFKVIYISTRIKTRIQIIPDIYRFKIKGIFTIISTYIRQEYTKCFFAISMSYRMCKTNRIKQKSWGELE